MRRNSILIICSLLAACQSTPVPGTKPDRTTTTVNAVASTTPFDRLTGSLAHEGGIVFVKPISGIASSTAQSSAASLSVELSAQLQSERAMRDAGLLASAPAPSAYALLEIQAGRSTPQLRETDPVASEADTPASGARATGGVPLADAGASGESPKDGDGSRTKPEPSPWFANNTMAATGGEPRSKVHEQERVDAENARSAWKGLSEKQRRDADKVHQARDQKLRARIAQQLEQKAKLFQRGAADQTAKTADGGKTVTSTFHIPATAGGRTVTVTRSYDAQGSLVQSVETIVGTVGAIGIDGERSRTFRPDGTEAVAMDFRLTIDGKVHTIRWDKQVGTDGSLSGKGTITRPDGSVLTLSAKAAPDAAAESIAGKDDASGMIVELSADSGSSKATAKFDVGKAGAAEVEFNLDQ